MSEQKATITLKAEPFRAWLLRNMEETPPPYSSYAQRPEAFQYWWKMLRAVFHIPSPSALPRATYPDDELELLNHYLATCRELASMTVLSFDGAITFHAHGSVTRDLPPADTLRGALVTLRQLEKADEDGSFAKAWKVVARRLHEIDPEASKRHNLYRLVQNKLTNGYLVKMADVQACIMQDFDTNIAMSLHHSGKPIDVINEAMYTGHVHWNRKRAAVGAMGQAKDEVFAGLFDSDLYDSVIQLSHWKFAYAEFLEHQIGVSA
jgi:hypothetical protein